MRFIEKLIYFSDGCGAHYKNFKDFENLKYHFQDFSLKDDWRFLPHLMTKINVMALVAQEND